MVTEEGKHSCVVPKPRIPSWGLIIAGELNVERLGAEEVAVDGLGVAGDTFERGVGFGCVGALLFVVSALLEENGEKVAVFRLSKLLAL
jgi:hypothetical protein